MVNTFNLKKFLSEGKLLKEEQNNDIVSFLKMNKNELLQVLSQKFNWDEMDLEDYDENEIEPGINAEGEPDSEIAVLGDGLEFSFNPAKVKDDENSSFTLNIGGKTIYGLTYTF